MDSYEAARLQPGDLLRLTSEVMSSPHVGAQVGVVRVSSRRHPVCSMAILCQHTDDQDNTVEFWCWPSEVEPWEEQPMADEQTNECISYEVLIAARRQLEAEGAARYWKSEFDRLAAVKDARVEILSSLRRGEGASPECIPAGVAADARAQLTREGIIENAQGRYRLVAPAQEPPEPLDIDTANGPAEDRLRKFLDQNRDRLGLFARLAIACAMDTIRKLRYQAAQQQEPPGSQFTREQLFTIYGVASHLPYADSYRAKAEQVMARAYELCFRLPPE